MRLGTNLPFDATTHIDGKWQMDKAVACLAEAGIKGCLHNFVGEEDKWEPVANQFAKLLKQAGLTLLEYNAPFFIPTKSKDTCRDVADRIVRLLAIAESIGCLNVGTCIMGPDVIFPDPANRTPETRDILKRTCGFVADGAQRLGLRARLELEIVYTTVLATPQEMADFVDEIASPNVQGHMDIVNCLTFDNIFDHSDFIRYAFATLGGRFHSAHIKDARPIRSYLPGLEEVLVGEGRLDLKTYIECLAAMPAGFPAVIEHVAEMKDIARSYRRVKELADSIGISVWDN